MGVIVWTRRVLLVILGILGSVLVMCLLLHLSGYRWQTRTVQAVEQSLRFPFEVPGTTLVARELVAHEDTAAIVLENKGTMGISCARVILKWAEGAYVFDVDMLPAKGKVIVPERAAQMYDLHLWTDCAGIQLSDPSEWADAAVQAEPVEQTKLKLTNTLDVGLKEVYIYYKSVMPRQDTLLGGRVKRYKVGDLLPGEEIYLEPYGFSWADCEIVRISCQEEY